MQGVLYVSHGSRVEDTKTEVEKVVEAAHQGNDDALHKLCYLEIASPDIREGAEELIAEGADRIAIVPMLLFGAGHYYSDIPEEIIKLQHQYPAISFTYGEPIGPQEALIQTLADRIRETKSEDPFLLVARGSRYPETKKMMESIMERVKDKTGITQAEVCYLAVLDPTFEQGLKKEADKYPEGLTVLPCLWFTGRLISHIEAEIKSLNDQGFSIRSAHYLEDHPRMVEALESRVLEAMDKEPYSSGTEEDAAHDSATAYR
ncbi:sirohydrochlorin chelatase [Salimicrobium sp. PL1-032A]|uniref:sirohydrochlorin chelatase n=1 Tax=Salimicrobium sp. PL1-032A TaxID=3095364 RepID=UPI0032600FBF